MKRLCASRAAGRDDHAGAELDGTDQLEFPEQGPEPGGRGLGSIPAAALETIIYPTRRQLAESNACQPGTLEDRADGVYPHLFIWSRPHLPVR